MDDIHYMSVRRLSDALRAREVSAAELADAHLARIEALDGKLGSYLAVTPERAREQAAAADAVIAAGGGGPLTGVPMQLKDNLATRGVTTTCGSRMLESYVPPYDATVTQRLAEAGSVLLGKGNMDEYAMGSSTETSAFKTARTPGTSTACQADRAADRRRPSRRAWRPTRSAPTRAAPSGSLPPSAASSASNRPTDS